MRGRYHGHHLRGLASGAGGVIAKRGVVASTPFAVAGGVIACQLSMDART